jgi:hypothetical protein
MWINLLRVYARAELLNEDKTAGLISKEDGGRDSVIYTAEANSHVEIKLEFRQTRKGP